MRLTVTTARENLLQSLIKLTEQPFNQVKSQLLARLLNSYRIQKKEGKEKDNEMPARDYLQQQIESLWQQNISLDKKAINKILTCFRMQIKLPTSRKKYHLGHPQPDNAGSVELTRAQIKENFNKQENAYFRDKNNSKKGNDAVAGGPEQKNNNRGQCPKCRSIGVVLARSYGGEDYYSCIYCGYQSYPNKKDPNIDLPLAAKILSTVYGDSNTDED